MGKTFNTTGYCDPKLHYMVDLTERLRDIREMVDAGKYFSINRARQYGKTTILTALADYLEADYDVISMDFQGFSYDDFQSEQNFIAAFSRQMMFCTDDLPADVREELEQYSAGRKTAATLSMLFFTLLKLCKESRKKIVLIIDEVDSAANNQIFIDFLAQLRFYYLKREKSAAFHSVILAGICDIRNIRRKIRSDEAHMENSPWNIAADFDVEMSFSPQDIEGMLRQYEAEHHTGMDVERMAELLYSYTSGYPYLVSRLCKLIDERVAGTAEFPDKACAWTEAGYLAAVKMLLEENNPLFDSLINKLNQYPELRSVVLRNLFQGQPAAYSADDSAVRNARMFGFVKAENGTVQIANRIFETRLYNYFLTLPEVQRDELYQRASLEKNQFISDGRLDVRRILEKFTEHFDEIYGDREQKFYEEDGRRYFLLYLKPIINGVGNYYIEARTRNQERTDLIIDYRGTQFVIEMKVWRGNAYHERGEEQLIEYLDHYHLEKGYMLSFNFNKKKEIGVKEIRFRDKILIEAVV